MFNLTNTIGFIAAFCTTISFVPQALQTIKTKNTKGISLLMYSLFTFGTLLWLLFGVMLGNYPMIIANGITNVLAIIILVYKIKYK